jgi:hypothetical protein
MSETKFHTHQSHRQKYSFVTKGWIITNIFNYKKRPVEDITVLLGNLCPDLM